MSTVIDIAIGLAFIFALVALICTGLQEWLSASLNLRGKTLWEGVQSMLLANAKATDGKPDPGWELNELLAEHPLVKGRVPDRFNLLDLVRWIAGSRQPTANTGTTKPSYLEGRTFATALADVIGEKWKGGSRRFDDFGLAVAAIPNDAGGSPGPLKNMLLKMVDEAQGDPARLRAALEAWYDETMKRVSGWYKRRTQVLLMAIGLLVAVTLNVDAIFIGNRLATNPALRESVAKQAIQAAEDYQAQARAAQPVLAASAPDESDAAYAEVAKRAREKSQAAQKQLQDLNLPIGWSGAGRPVNGIGDGFLLALGWLLTAMAASFGAPFWFDLIGRLAPLRASGNKPSSDATTPQPVSPAGTTTTAAAPAVAAAPGSAPFRDALNDYEASGIGEIELLRIKRLLGVTGPNALTPILDQQFRDAIQVRQKLKAWPATGELSAQWVQALLAGTA